MVIAVKLLGALCVVAACAALGFLAGRELKERVRTVEALQRLTERMRTAVCRRRLPLPSVMRELAEEAPGLFGAAADMTERLGEESFADIWGATVRAARLSGRESAALTELGRSLSRGGEAERAFELCAAALEEARAEAREAAAVRGKLYVSLGLTAGLLLAVILY